MKFEFIVCTRNNEKIIGDCINSINNLKMKETWKYKITVVDDASEDNTADAAINCDNVNALIMPENEGPAYCRNYACKVSTFNPDFFVFMDSDVRFNEHFLLELMKEMKDEIVIAGPKLLFPNGTINAAGGGIARCGIGYDIGIGEKEDLYDYTRDSMYICSAAMIMKSSAINKIGLFDETFFYGHEDTDLGWRARLMGYKVRYVASARAVHMKNQTVKGDQERIHFHTSKNHLRSIMKNYNTYNMVKYLLFYSVLMCGFLLFRPCRLARFKGVIWFLKHWKSHLKERKIIQSKRILGDEYLKFGGLLPK